VALVAGPTLQPHGRRYIGWIFQILPDARQERQMQALP
jgi:hypothetical protein